MPKTTTIKLILCWHMHQPQYKSSDSGNYQLPWTYLHTLKDYTDMVAYLEMFPKAKAVINFSPVLLEQIEDYARQVKDNITSGVPIRDPLLSLLTSKYIPKAIGERSGLIKACLRINHNEINRFPSYAFLKNKMEVALKSPEDVLSLSEQDLEDLLVWYHIAWMGETVHRSNKFLKSLVKKRKGFTFNDRTALLELIGDIFCNVLSRYAALEKNKQIELSMTPYAHPILPLLQNIYSAREAIPNLCMPILPEYPGGNERARWHIEEGRSIFQRIFGIIPAGCWLAEGGISTLSAQLLDEYGFKWVASGEVVLRNSLEKLGLNIDSGVEQPYHLSQTNIACYFRSDDLSDLIGFSYASWNAEDAVSDFITELEAIAQHNADKDYVVVPVILDGENAWEWYPNHAYNFFHNIYDRLTNHPYIELTTFSECLDATQEHTVLPGLVAGSWIYGTFSTWIGSPEKNRAWDFLGNTKKEFDIAVAQGRLTDQLLYTAQRQLALCEGSDWFWWFDKRFEFGSQFDELFHSHLKTLSEIIGTSLPDEISPSSDDTQHANEP